MSSGLAHQQPFPPPTPATRPALPCCPGTLQVAGGGVSFPAFTRSSTMPRKGHAPPTSTCTQVAAQPRHTNLAFGGNRTLRLQVCEPRYGPPAAAQVRNPPWSPATHIRLLLTNLKTPVLPLFIGPASFCFSFSSISPPLSCSCGL